MNCAERLWPIVTVIGHIRPIRTIFYKRAIPYLLILPALFIVGGVLLYPTVELLRFSFLDWSFGKELSTAEWTGLDNYLWLLSSPSSTLLHALKLTLIYVVASITIELLLGMVIALLLNQNLVGRSLLVTGFMIPAILMPVMVGMMWRMYFYQNGIVNYILRTLFGLDINWYSATWAMPAVILVEVWQGTPFFVLSLLAGLRALPEEIFEAAEVDGASAWQRFLSITVPLLKPVIIVCAIIRTMWLLKAFDVIYVMYTGGPGSATEVLGLTIYRALFLARRIGVSSAISIILILLSLAVTFVFIRFLYRTKTELEV
ncbi:MAG: sugar ABC transporter permease [Candidatus Methanomethyliaceae archaeon]